MKAIFKGARVCLGCPFRDESYIFFRVPSMLPGVKDVDTAMYGSEVEGSYFEGM